MSTTLNVISAYDFFEFKVSVMNGFLFITCRIFEIFFACVYKNIFIDLLPCNKCYGLDIDQSKRQTFMFLWKHFVVCFLLLSMLSLLYLWCKMVFLKHTYTTRTHHLIYDSRRTLKSCNGKRNRRTKSALKTVGKHAQVVAAYRRTIWREREDIKIYLCT